MARKIEVKGIQQLGEANGISKKGNCWMHMMRLLAQAAKPRAGRRRTGMDSSLFDVLHDAADDNVAVLVTEGVHIQLICSIQVLVHQHRPVRVHFHRILYVPLQVLVTAGAELALGKLSCRVTFPG